LAPRRGKEARGRNRIRNIVILNIIIPFLGSPKGEGNQRKEVCTGIQSPDLGSPEGGRRLDSGCQYSNIDTLIQIPEHQQSSIVIRDTVSVPWLPLF
jgi:hypothetical protein